MAERSPFNDPEIEAMAQILEALEPFDTTVRRRILGYVTERLRREPVPTPPGLTEPAAEGETDNGTR